MTEDKEGNRRLRQKERKVYVDDIDEDEIEGGNKRTFSVEEKLVSDKFNKTLVAEMTGDEITVKFMQETGMKSPILVKEKTGLGMRIPGENFTVNDVRQCVGSRRMLDVMDVQSQKALEMSMKEWVNYYLGEEKDRLLNVISLEFSHTRLENYVEQPTIVKQLDWIETVWPSFLKENQTETTNMLEQMKYPKVQKYCLMSVGGCYTDFHIDMGGTSVWYHILKGSKVFWLIPPTEENLNLFEKWVKSGRQGDEFFGDKVKECCRVHLQKGNTFFIPTGWIHAVHTPEDSLVFGGNFLHSFGVEMQLRIWEIESRTHVPMKFRYPMFTELQWYVLDQYLNCVNGTSYRVKSAEEIKAEKEDNKDDDSIKTEDDADSSFRNGEADCACGNVLCTSSSCNAMDNSRKTSRSNSRRSSSSSSTSASNSDLIKPVSVKLENCMLMDKKKLVMESKKNSPKPKVILTKSERRGLCLLLEWIQKLPPTKRLVPKDIKNPDQLVADMKKLLEEHYADDAAQACTGYSIIKWPTKKKKVPTATLR